MAIYKTFDVSLDLKRPVSSRDVEVVEGDNGNRLRVTLTDEGSPVDLSGCLVLAVFAKTNGTVQQDTNGNGVTISGDSHNIIEIELYTSSFAPGVVGCELQIYSGDNSVLVTTAKFNFKCRRSIVNEDTIQSTEEFPLLLELITQVDELYKQLDGAQVAEAERVAAEQIRKTNETARVSAESVRVSNEESRETAEETRIQAESERKTAESTRLSAETARKEAENQRVIADTGRSEAEAERVTAETNRISAESARASAETRRVSAESARVTAETARANAETNRASAESARVSAENKRASAETARVSAETERAQAESVRVVSENNRNDAEADRAAAESIRVAAESKRVTDETARASAESSRASAETARASAETTRVNNETARVTAENERAAKDAARVYQGDYSAAVTYLAGNTLTYNGSTYLCLKDSTGNAPTNTTYFALVSKAGRGIKSIVQTTTSTASGGTNVITVTYDDNTTSTFEVRNGTATIPIDNAMSATSENPVQNKVVKKYVDESIADVEISVPTGMLKGNSDGSIAQAVAGTDYQAPLRAGTDYQTPLEAGTDYQVPLSAGTGISISGNTISLDLDNYDGGTF